MHGFYGAIERIKSSASSSLARNEEQSTNSATPGRIWLWRANTLLRQTTVVIFSPTVFWLFCMVCNRHIHVWTRRVVTAFEDTTPIVHPLTVIISSIQSSKRRQYINFTSHTAVFRYQIYNGA